MTSSLPPEERSDAWVYVECAGTLAGDLSAGRLASLDSYRARWPQAPELVEAAWRDLIEGEGEEDAARAPGEEFAGYRLLRELGRGGQATVFLAHDERLGRSVALKVLRRTFADGDDARLKRFRREAEATARLEHPAIAPVYGAGVERGEPWMAMRFVAGETLARRMARTDRAERRATEDAAPRATRSPQRRRPVDVGPADQPAPDARTAAKRLALYFATAADAVQAAHSAGILHRDLKPANLMVTPAGEPVVLDFGVARALDENSADEPTTAGVTPGTPGYAAPEVLRGAPCDARADVFALGVALYESLAGRRPFAGPTPEALQRAILDLDPPPPSAFADGVSRDLDVVVATALEKDLARRYASAQSLAEDLRRFAADEPVHARPASRWTRLSKWARRDPLRALWAALALLAGVAVASLGGYLTARAPELAAAEAAAVAEAREAEIAGAFVAYGEAAYAEAFARFERLVASAPDDPEAEAGAVLAALELRGPAAAESRLAAAEKRGATLAPVIETLRGLAENRRREDAAASRARRGLSASRPSSGAALADETTMRAATQATAAEFAPASRPDGGDAFSNAPTSRRAAALRDVAESELLAGSVASSPALRALVAFLGASRLRAEALRSPGVDLRPALALAERATSSAPRQRLPYQLLRLELLAKTGRTDEAVDAARLLRSVWPHSATALGRAAGLLLDAGALDEALALAEEAARLAPHDRFARYALGGVLVMTGRVADGLAQLDAAIDGAPTPRLLSARGAAYFFLGRFDEAERELTAAVAEGPLQSVAWNNLSALRLERGDYAGAVEAAEIALKLSPHKASAHANLGTAWSSLRRFGEAEIALRRARELAHESPESDARYAAVLMALGRKEEALALARAAAARAPNDDETQFAVARVFVDGGFAAEAVGLLTPMLARGPRGVQKHVVLAKAYLALGRRGEAEGVLEEAMRLAPRDAEVRYVHVAAALQAKDAATAVARAEEAVRVAPQSAVAWEAAAIARLEHGDTAAGIAAVRRGLEAEPARPNLLRTLAAALFREGRYAEAAEAYRGFVAAAPDDPRAHRGFLDAALRARTVDPLPEFRRWSERRPNDLAAKVDLARALLRSAGDAGVAGATTRPGSAAQPSAAPDAAAEAVALCEEVVRLGKGARIEFDGTVALGEALLAVGRRHGARDALERAERLAPPTDTRSDAVRGLTRLREALDEE